MLGPTLVLALAAAAGEVPYAPGERTEYTVEYLGITMGKARLALGRPEGALLPVFLEAKTTGVGTVYALREQLSTLLDAATGLPRSATIEAWEGSYHHVDTTRFDRAANEAVVRQRGKYDHTYEVSVAPETVEFLGLVFRLRGMPLAPGVQRVFSVLQGKDVRPVTVDVLGRELVETPEGRLPCLKVKIPTGLTGRFAEKDPTYVWFSDDARRVVVRISTHFAIGRMVVALRSYEAGRSDSTAGQQAARRGAQPSGLP